MKQLKRIRGLKDVKLSVGSELVLYRTKGEKIEKEEKKEDIPVSSLSDKDIETAKLRMDDSINHIHYQQSSFIIFTGFIIFYFTDFDSIPCCSFCGNTQSVCPCRSCGRPVCVVHVFVEMVTVRAVSEERHKYDEFVTNMITKRDIY